MREAGAIGPLRFAAALSDGRALYAFRAADDRRPPSLYLTERDDGVVVASEPLDTDAGWLPVADGEALVADAAGWRLQPLPAWQLASAPGALAAAQPA